jgi:undecaprenyl-diphosphatase
MLPDWLNAIILGIVEGLTEFIPVSSTAMLLLTERALGLDIEKWDTFTVLIQLGAILAVVALYFQRLWSVALRLPHDPNARRFVLSVLVAFLPAMVLGALLHDKIEGLFKATWVIAASLLIGGVVLLVIDRFKPAPMREDAMRLPLTTSFMIGLFQCLAMIPGTSRSGATIVGAMLQRVEKRAAAEFSFFLAIPTMTGAFVYEAYKKREQLMHVNDASTIAIGFVVSFIFGAFVVKTLLDFVSKHGFAPFGWFRVLLAFVVLGLFFTGVWA